MLPSGSPVTGQVVSKSGLGAVAPGELVEFAELPALLHPVAEIEITAIASKIPEAADTLDAASHSRQELLPKQSKCK
jgi:hypothetical protein